MAVADFGSPAELAAEFQPTVASRMVSRAALLGSTVLPLVMAGWAAVYGRPPQVHGPAAAHPLSGLVYLIGTLLIVCSLVALHGNRDIHSNRCGRAKDRRTEKFAMMLAHGGVALSISSATLILINLSQVVAVVATAGRC